MTIAAAKITVHMVSSLDGFIAKKDGSISWLETTDTYEKGVTEENAEEFMKTIDCFVMGSRTYEHAVELSKDYGWAYGDVPTFILTRRNLPAVGKSIEFYSGDLKKFVSETLNPKFKNVWVVGGAAVVKDFIRLGLVNDIRLTIVPIIVGDGTLFFDYVGCEQALHLKDVSAFKNGMVELWYEVRIDSVNNTH
jgi:dihydrofolate reductase